MYEGKTVAVVVPAYNEEKLMAATVRGMPVFVDRVIVVDDCSRDGTAERGRRSADPRVGSSTTSGTAASAPPSSPATSAPATGEVDVTCVMAGDTQMDPADLATLVGRVASGECDYTKGNRLFTGQAWKIIPRYRYLGNAVLSFFTKIASGYWHVADRQSGYTAITLETLRVLELDRLYPRYGFPNDLLVELNIWNFRVRDVPIRPVYDVGEESGIRLRKVVPTSRWLLVKGFFWRMKEKYVIRDFHPLVFFYLLGMSLAGAGFALGLLEVVLRVMGNPIPVATIVLVALLVVSGLQLLLFAMWFDMESNRSLTPGAQSNRLELPGGRRVVVVYEGSADAPVPAATAATAAAGEHRRPRLLPRPAPARPQSPAPSPPAACAG